MADEGRISAYALATLRARSRGRVPQPCSVRHERANDRRSGPDTIRSSMATLARDDLATARPRRGLGLSTPTTIRNWLVANSLAAVAAGVATSRGTINGYGERCGNANLVSVMADLELKTPFEPVPSGRLAGLTEMSRYVAEIVNIAPTTTSRCWAIHVCAQRAASTAPATAPRQQLVSAHRTRASSATSCASS